MPMLCAGKIACLAVMASSSSSSSSGSRKRKCVVLTCTLEQKLAILDASKRENCKKNLPASEYGAGRSTISDIKKSEEKLKSYASTMESLSISSKTRKVMHLADDENLDEAVYLWFVQRRSQDMPVSGSILCEKATQLQAQLHQGGSEDSKAPFQASRGWLWRFCQHHGIRQLSLQGEKVPSDASAVEPFQNELQELMEREHLTLDQLYNCDETGLCYRMLLNKTCC